MDNKKYKQKKRFNHSKLLSFLIPILLLVLFVLLIVAGLHIYNNFRRVGYSNDFCNNFATIYGAVAGGVCAIVGGIIAFVVGFWSKKDERRKALVPAFYMPSNCDTAKINKCLLKSESTRNRVIVNNTICFKNSMKTPFVIDGFYIDGSNPKEGCYFCEKCYIDKGESFALTFYSKLSINNIVLVVTSIDKLIYEYDIDIANKKVTERGEFKCSLLTLKKSSK